MLTAYIQAAMAQAQYELLEDGTFYGEIPRCPGVYANAPMLAMCLKELQEVLEGWIVLGLHLGHPLPEIEGISLDTILEPA